MRRVLSIAVGILIWFGLDYLFYRQPDQTRVLSGEVIQFLKVVQAPAQLAALHIVPWLVTGALAGRNHVLCGAIAAASASAIDSALSVSLFPSSYYGQLLVTSLALAVLAGMYGAAGGALGLQLARSNNSFKPNPLRGSA